MITVIGSINLDLIATTTRLPQPGETVPGKAFSTAPGGKGANQALAARRAGADVRMVAAVGRDAFADAALALLKRDGVDLSLVRPHDGATGVALILVDGRGENMITVVPGTNGLVSPRDVEALPLRPGEHVLLQHEIALDTVEASLQRCRATGAVALLNTAPFLAEAAPLLAQAEIVIANETEFDLYGAELALDGTDRRERMIDFARRTGRTIVVTLGADGVLGARGGEIVHAHGLQIEPVDTVGAGDTFCGYLAAGLDEGRPFASALRRAAVAGSLACLLPGAQPSIPRGDAVERRCGDAPQA